MTDKKGEKKVINHLDYLPEASDAKRDSFLNLAAGTDKICESYLDDEYREICRGMAASIVHEGKPVLKGLIQSWVGGIVHAAGWVNFLQDPTQPYHMTTAQLAKRCGVSVANMTDKSGKIRKALDIIRLDPDWSRAELLLKNPAVWMFRVDDRLVDMRTAPRVLQEQAYEEGLIPFIPDDCLVESPAEESLPTTEKSKTERNKLTEKDVPFFDLPNGFTEKEPNR